MDVAKYPIPLWDVFNCLDKKVNDLACYDLQPSSPDCTDVNSLEPSLWTKHMIFDLPSWGINHSTEACRPGGFDESSQRFHHQHSPSSSSSLSRNSVLSTDCEEYPPLTPSKQAPLYAKPEPQSKVGAKPKTTKRRRNKKDPNEPQKPASAYSTFFHEVQPMVKQKYGATTFGEISKIVAGMWDNLDQPSKSGYKARTEKAKQEYLKELAAYRASNAAMPAAPVTTKAEKSEMTPPSVQHSPLFSAMQQRQQQRQQYVNSQNAFRYNNYGQPQHWQNGPANMMAHSQGYPNSHIQRPLHTPLTVPQWGNPQKY